MNISFESHEVFYYILMEHIFMNVNSKYIYSWFPHPEKQKINFETMEVEFTNDKNYMETLR